MAMEEWQLRAWVRTVFLHTATRWSRHHQQRQYGVVSITQEESERWGDYHDMSTDVDNSLWLQECLLRLQPRDKVILLELGQGKTQVAVAQIAECDQRTVRRAIRRIRTTCPH
jgi:RNA polymerase sigma factor (sigma-70 family)